MSKRPTIAPIGSKPNELEITLSAIRRDMPQYLAQAVLVAQIRKAGYDEYLKQGFTEEQALELCKTVAL